MSLVPIIMGSKSDLKHGQEIAAELAKYGIASEIRVVSADKAPQYALGLLAGYEADPQPKVYVTVAGRNNACPVGWWMARSRRRSSLVRPIPIALAAPMSSRRCACHPALHRPSCLEPSGAALLAAKILGLLDPVLRERVAISTESLRRYDYRR